MSAQSETDLFNNQTQPEIQTPCPENLPIDQAFLTHQLLHNQQTLQTIFTHWQQNKTIDPNDLKLTLKQSRFLASFLAMSVIDSIGLQLRYHTQSKQSKQIKHTKNPIKQQIKELYKIQKTIKFERGLATQLSCCIAYSLIQNNLEFFPRHIRYMFQLWYQQGLGSAKNQSQQRGGGPAIDNSIESFIQNPTDYVNIQNQLQNGNGSIMRVAPTVIAFNQNRQNAIRNSQLQSLTTHDGLEAKQCCRLLASIVFDLANRGPNKDWKSILNKTCQKFKSCSKQVEFLAQSKMQTQEMYIQKQKKYGNSFTSFNIKYNDRKSWDRNWDWKSESFKYSQTRSKRYHDTVGSYCMDGLAMALHSVWHTNSLKQCMLFHLNKKQGDFNTVGAIALQIAGAIYGIDSDLFALYTETEDYRQKFYEGVLLPLELLGKKLHFFKLQNQQIDRQMAEHKELSEIINLSQDFPFPSYQHLPNKNKIIYSDYYTEAKKQLTPGYNNGNKEIYELMHKLNQEGLLSNCLNIYEGKDVVIKKLILPNYWKKFDNHDNGFHGTKVQNILPIAKKQLKIPGQIVNGQLIQVDQNHIQLGTTYDGVENYAKAIFTSPSIFYAAHKEYTKKTLNPLNTRTLQDQSWRAVIQVKLKRGTYTKHPATTQHIFPIDGEPSQVEYRLSKNDSGQVTTVAIVLISRKLLDQQNARKFEGQKYSYVTDYVLRSKEQILMRAKKYRSQILPN